MTEATGEIGDDFSNEYAKSWEMPFNTTNPKRGNCITHTSIVMGKYGGATEPLKI
jgi:NAD dependent epimerase/dehydratase family enzyme